MEKIKAFLNEYVTAQKQIESYAEERERLHYLATRVSSAEHPSYDQVGNGASRTADMDRQIQDAINDLQEKRRRIVNVINRIEDCTIRTVLQMKYLSGMSVLQIADKLYYSERWVKALHQRGLDAIKQILQGK